MNTEPRDPLLPQDAAELSEFDAQIERNFQRLSKLPDVSGVFEFMPDHPALSRAELKERQAGQAMFDL